MDKLIKHSDYTSTLWLLGNHRLYCGDSTNETHINRLCGNRKATLLHADPPYGMGKERQGIINDNLYDQKLDEFQLKWWRCCKEYLTDNASAYIWGTAPNLWRLWYQSGLKDFKNLSVKNEIVWNKGTGWNGCRVKHFRSYAPNTERCLFMTLGDKKFNSNAKSYWAGWDSLRNKLKENVKKAGWTYKQVQKITGVKSLHKHWFVKSQWIFISEKHYIKLQQAAKGKAFTEDYQDLLNEYQELKEQFNKIRPYFNNTHEKMSDVWEFPRVPPKERYRHATPKPLKMIERIIKTSSKENDYILTPFGGSGTTLIACEQTKRKCLMMEIRPLYINTIIKRWESLTGKTAVKGVFDA